MTRAIERRALRRAAAVVYAGGPALGDLLVEHLRLAPDRVISVSKVTFRIPLVGGSAVGEPNDRLRRAREYVEYAHDDARRMYQFALYRAEQSGDWHLRALVLSCMARQAIWCGDPDAGLTFIELAMVRSDRLTATERALLHTGRAHALAKLGRIQDAVAAVGTADEEFSRARQTNDPVIVTNYDAAMHAGETGRALWDLAVSGHFVAEARNRLSTAATGRGEGFARLRVMDQIKIASLVMVTGDPDEAATIGRQALDTSSTIRSHRTADFLHELRRLSQPHQKMTAVAELTHRIGSAVALPRTPAAS